VKRVNGAGSIRLFHSDGNRRRIARYFESYGQGLEQLVQKNVICERDVTHEYLDVNQVSTVGFEKLTRLSVKETDGQ